MRRKLLDSFVLVLIVGCLLFALSDSPRSVTAILGFIGIGISVVLLIAGLFSRDSEDATPVELAEAEQRRLAQVKAERRQTAAIRALRESRPGLSIAQARSMIEELR